MSIKKILGVFNHPKVKFLTAFILLISGVLEISESAIERFWHIDIRVFHGIIFFAVTKVLGSMAEIVEGTQKVSEARKAKAND